MALAITSTAFAYNGEIPQVYTCEGQDISPPLQWTGIPDRAKSLALIVEDPDAPDPRAPKMVWIHWVLYNIPADTSGLSEAISSPPSGALAGLNGWKHTGYRGPCPPIGRHRYFFKLYVLGSLLRDLQKPTRQQLMAAMKGHVLGVAELVGTYRKQSKQQ